MALTIFPSPAKQDGEMQQSMVTSMAQSMVHTPMLASMNLPSFQPPSAHSTGTLVGEDEDPASAGPSVEHLPEDMLPPGASSEHCDLLPPNEMTTSLSQKRYIFDDQYPAMEQSYREARRPITMTESVPGPARVRSASEAMRRSLPTGAR